MIRAMLFRRAVVAAVIVSLTACSTMRAIEDFSPSRIQEQVAVGDEVRIAATNGKVYELTVTQVEAESLTGRTTGGKVFKVQYTAIQYIEVEKIDGWKTAGATLGSAVIVLYALMVYALYAFFDAIDDSSE